MRPLPIDVLRAFVTVVDARGFTRAAEELGRSQPAVSLQIKRLEELIGATVFEKSARLELTNYGKVCLKYARRILETHDELSDAIERERGSADAMRLGIPGELAPSLVASLAGFSQGARGGVGLEFTCDASETLLERLRNRQLDVAVALTNEASADDAICQWRMPMGWISAPGFQVPQKAPLPLVTTPEGSLYHEVAAAALHRAGRRFEVVWKSADIEALTAAVGSGFGVSPFVRSLAPKSARFVPASSIVALPDVALGVYTRDDLASPTHPIVESLIGWLGALSSVKAL